jgi:hypothetical protein
MILGKVMIQGTSCKCDVCGYPWVSIADREPDMCRNRYCRSREWNGKKQKRRPAPKPKIILPKPQRIRNDDSDEDF